MGIPDEYKRHDILKVIVPPKAISSNADLHYLAQATPGFTGADLSSLVRFAMTHALERWSSSDDEVTENFFNLILHENCIGTRYYMNL